MALVALAILAPGGSVLAQKPGNDATLKSATETAEKIRKATGSTPAAVKLPPGDPCGILPLAEVRKAFPGARAGERSRRLEQYGMTECGWKDSNGMVVVAVQESYSSGTAQEDAEGMAIGFTDPLKPSARKSVKIERLPGLGDDAAAFIERTDAARGILSDGAMLSIRRGEHQISVMSNQLPKRERAAALKTLGELGQSAAKRL